MLSDQEMREKIVNGLIAHAEGEIALHKTNVEVYLAKTVGIGEHSDILETVQKELETTDNSWLSGETKFGKNHMKIDTLLSSST